MNKRQILLLSLQLVVGTVLISLLLWGLGWLISNGYLEMLLDYIDSLGKIGSICMIVLLVIVHIPFSLGYAATGMACGFLYHMIGGTITIVIGCFIGANVGYWITRLLLRRFIEEKIKNSRVEVVALMQEINTNPWKISILIRFIPIPIGFQNAMLAVSPISYGVFLITSVIGMFPEQLMFVYLGSSFNNLAQFASGKVEFSWVEGLISATGICGLILLVLVVLWMGRRALQSARKMQLEAGNIELSEVVEAGDHIEESTADESDQLTSENDQLNDTKEQSFELTSDGGVIDLQQLDGKQYLKLEPSNEHIAASINSVGIDISDIEPPPIDIDLDSGSEMNSLNGQSSIHLSSTFKAEFPPLDEAPSSFMNPIGSSSFNAQFAPISIDSLSSISLSIPPPSDL